MHSLISQLEGTLRHVRSFLGNDGGGTGCFPSSLFLGTAPDAEPRSMPPSRSDSLWSTCDPASDYSPQHSHRSQSPTPKRNRLRPDPLGSPPLAPVEALPLAPSEALQTAPDRPPPTAPPSGPADVSEPDPPAPPRPVLSEEPDPPAPPRPVLSEAPQSPPEASQAQAAARPATPETQPPSDSARADVSEPSSPEASGSAPALPLLKSRRPGPVGLPPPDPPSAEGAGGPAHSPEGPPDTPSARMAASLESAEAADLGTPTLTSSSDSESVDTAPDSGMSSSKWGAVQGKVLSFRFDKDEGRADEAEVLSPKSGGSMHSLLSYSPTSSFSRLVTAIGAVGKLTAGLEKHSMRSLKEETWFNLILDGDLEGFQKMAHRDPAVLKERDPTGATPLHLLLLNSSRASHAVVKEIITEYPELCKAQYTGDQYDGEVETTNPASCPCPCPWPYPGSCPCPCLCPLACRCSSPHCRCPLF